MKEPGQIKSFEQLGQVFDEKKKKYVREVFEKVLQGKIKKFPKANYKSNLPGVRTVNVFPVLPEGERPKIVVQIFYETPDKRENHFMMSCFEDGEISGKIKNGVQFTREELNTEIMYILESVNVDLLHETDLPILPDSDEGDEREPGTQGVDKIKGPPARPERLTFLNGQKSLLFYFYNRKQGFNSYRGYLFSNPSGKIFAVLETDVNDHAAFVVDTNESLEVDSETLKKPARLWIKTDDRDKITNRVWKPLSTARTRRALQTQFGATRVTHQGESWQDRLQEEIDKRMAVVKE